MKAALKLIQPHKIYLNKLLTKTFWWVEVMVMTEKTQQQYESDWQDDIFYPFWVWL